MQRDAGRVGENVLQEVAVRRVHPEGCLEPFQLLADLIEPRQDLVSLDLLLGLDPDKIVCGNRRGPGRGQAGSGIGKLLGQRCVLGDQRRLLGGERALLSLGAAPPVLVDRQRAHRRGRADPE